jgi:hypothetical protein
MMSCKPIKTHEQFLKDLDKVHPNKDWEVIGKYEHNKIPILLRDKYGDCLIPPNNLLQRSRPSVKTAINKTEYTINKFKEVWGDTYDYSKFIYEGARDKSIIICKKHGEFLQDANMHLSGRCGCGKCANESISSRVRSNTTEFIEKAISKYGTEMYSFDKTIYNTATENVTITCNKHGDFEQTPNRFLNGQVCLKCTYKENTSNYHTLKKRRNNSIFYIIECFNENESFIKMGVTSRSIKVRFRDSYDMPYNYKVLREFRYANIEASDALETQLLKFTKSATYLPNLKFNGQTEARNINIKNSLLDLFDVYSDELYYIAFINFAKAYSGIFDVEILKSGNYSELEIETVMKGYAVHKKLENLKNI